MFQLDWSEQKEKNICEYGADNIAPYSADKIEMVQFSFWAEHCLECTPPQCYKSCGYYQKRCDGRCKRTENGQERVEIPGAVLGYGVRVKLRPWAKLETYAFGRPLTMEAYKTVSRRYRARTGLLEKLGKLNIGRVLNGAGYFFITRSKWRTTRGQDIANVFLLEIWSCEKTAFQMLIEAADADLRVIAREAVTINPGFNSNLMDYSKIAPDKTGSIRFYPENNIEAELIIVNAEFIRTKAEVNAAPAKKVKCVAWDLDNTLWNGVLSETSDPSALKLREGVIELIRGLDERGVLQTIVSKNDHEPAWAVVESLGLSQYFLYPAINWGQKSENLKKIARELNIGLDTFALIDDSAFERGEVAAALPQIRVFDENAVSRLLSLPELDVPATRESARRREMYQTEAKRKLIMAEYSGEFFDFLRSCEIEVGIGAVADDDIKERCYELVNRTNQLNITGRKYSAADFDKWLVDSRIRHLYFECRDRFGSYGVVGYIAVRKDAGNTTVEEFAVSCRIAQKHIEYAVLSWIARSICEKGELRVVFCQTEKNGPMRSCLADIGFTQAQGFMSIDPARIREDDGIIRLIEKDLC